MKKKNLLHKNLFKLLALVLTFAITATSFCACSSETAVKGDTNTNMPDFQYMFKLLGSETPVQKTDNGYYTMLSNMMLYVDGKTLDATPLCSKADCLHTTDFSDCNAKIENFYMGTADNFQICGNNIYVMCDDTQFSDGTESSSITTSLYQISLDGNTRNKVFTVNNSFIVDWFVLNGYLYYQAQTENQEEVSDTNVYVSGNFYKAKLNSNDTPTVLFNYEKSADAYGCKGSMVNVYDKYMYITEAGYSSEKAYKKVLNGEDIDEKDEVSYLLCINLEDGSQTIIDKNHSSITTIVSFDGILDGKLLYSVTSPENSEDIFISDLNGNNPSKLKTLDSDSYRIFCDEKYIYLDDGCLTDVENGKENRSYTVLDKTGKQLSQVYLPQELINEHSAEFYPTGFDEKYMWLKGQEDSNMALYCIDKSQMLNNGKKLEYKLVYKYE